MQVISIFGDVEEEKMALEGGCEESEIEVRMSRDEGRGCGKCGNRAGTTNEEPSPSTTRISKGEAKAIIHQLDRTDATPLSVKDGQLQLLAIVGRVQ